MPPSITESSVFPPLGPADLQPLREAFARAGYTDEGLLSLFGPVQLPNRADRTLPHFLHLTSGGRPLDTLVRLFLLAVPAGADEAAAAVAPLPLRTCEKWGLVHIRGNSVTAAVRMLPFRDLVLAVDHPDLPGIGERADQVMGLTASSVTLANFTVRRPSRRTLDIGAGSGIQALLAAPHSREVLATDSSRRALEFARFNAALNGCDNITFAEGDALAPAAGKRFDLIVCNPPFAVSPSHRLMYRDSGMEGDDFCRKLAREAPGFLEDGGLFQMLCDWVHPAGGNWQERLSEWFEGSGCDAWILTIETHDPAGYAHQWIRDTECCGQEEAAALYQTWLEYYAKAGIEAVGTGLIAMRRRSGRNWIRFEDMPEETSGPVGEQVALGFALRDYLESVTDDALLGARLRLSPDARLDQHSVPRDGAWRPESTRISLSEGIRYQGKIDARVANLVARCDGRRRLLELVMHMAVDLKADPEKIAPDIVAIVRGLMERGFLLPPE